MKALIFDGQMEPTGALDRGIQALSSRLEAQDWRVEKVRLRDLKVAPCTGCFKCWTRTPGVCQQDDDARSLTSKLAQTGLLVLVTPISFGGYGSLLKRALERAILPFLLPFFTQVDGEVHHPLRYGRALKLGAIGGLPRSHPESEGTFLEILNRNALNFHSTVKGGIVLYDQMTDKDLAAQVGALAGLLGSPQ